MKILIIAWAIGAELILVCMIITWCYCYGLTGVSHYKRKTKYRIVYSIMLNAGIDDNEIYAIVYKPSLAIQWAVSAWIWPVTVIAQILGL